MRGYDIRIIVKLRGSKLRKKFIKKLLSLAVGRMHPPHSPPPPESTLVANLVEMDSYQFCLGMVLCCGA